MPEETPIEPAFGVRVAGLPADRLEHLRCARTWQRITELLAANRRLAEDGGALADELYAVVAGLTEPALKPHLVALRRALRNVRRPGERAWNAEIGDALPAGLTERVRDWLVRLDAQRGGPADVERVLTAELAERHEALRAAAAQPALRFGLVHASPVLSEQLRKWLDTPPGTPPERKLAVRLSKYLSRVITKPSPYSTFTACGLGRWQPGPALRGTHRWAERGVAELNVWLTRRLVAATAGDPRFASGLVLRVNPSATEHRDTVEFLGPGPAEPILSLPLGAAVRVVLDLVRAEMSTVDSVALRLAEAGGKDTAAARSYVDKLVELGLLEPQPPVPDQAYDHLGELDRWLAGSPVAADGAAHLRALLEQYPALEDTGTRLKQHGEITGTVAELASALVPGGIDLPAKNVFHENVLLEGPVLTADPRHWQPVLADLDALRRFLGVLDPTLPGKLALAQLFTRVFGPSAEVPLLTFYRCVREQPPGELADLLRLPFTGFAALAASAVPEIRLLHQVRTAAVHALARQPVGADGVRALDREQLLALTRTWPRFVRAPHAVTCYAQAILGGERPGLVLNAVNSGFGRGRNRLRRLLGQAGAVVPPVAGEAGEEPLVAEFGGNLHSTIDLRELESPYRIGVPDAVEPPAAPGAHLIPLGDLVVCLDPGTGLPALNSASHGRRVLPVHTGLTAEFWLPPVLQFLIVGFGAAPTLLTTALRPFGDSSLDRAAAVRVEPRITVGSVTVSRARWALPAAEFPARPKGATDGAYLTRLAAWLATHGIPARCFVKVLDQSQFTRTGLLLTKARKPLYVDFANPWLVAVLERSITSGEDLVVIEEMLPGPADALGFGAAGARVTELIWEVRAPAGTGHREGASGR